MRGILSAVDFKGKHVIVGVFYFIGFGLFCLESVLSVWVIQPSKRPCISEAVAKLQAEMKQRLLGEP